MMGIDAHVADEEEALMTEAHVDSLLEFACDTCGEGEVESTTDMVRTQAALPQPFIRRVRLQLDAAGGTNRNKFVKQGIALGAAVGAYDVFDMDYMVVGHTKFAPDEVAPSAKPISCQLLNPFCACRRSPKKPQPLSTRATCGIRDIWRKYSPCMAQFSRMMPPCYVTCIASNSRASCSGMLTN